MASTQQRHFVATLLLTCIACHAAFAQTGYEVADKLPLCYPQMKATLTYPMAWQNSHQSFGTWRKKARQTLLSCAQPFPPDTTFAPQTITSEKRDGYTAYKITFNISAWQRIPAYLLVPDSQGKHPAMLMLHDHGAHFSIGKEKMVRPFDVPNDIATDAAQWTAKCYDSTFVADQYARQGYVVLVADALFWGERGQANTPNYDTQQALAANLMQMGYSWTGLMLHDDMRCADFLATLPQVDAKRIGALGFSMGAYRTWLLAAATDRIAAAAAICWMNTTQQLLVPKQNQTKGGSAYSMLLPGLPRYMDYPHVAAIACPKPMLFFGGERDKLSPLQGQHDAFETLRQTWHSQHADNVLTTELYDEKHFFNRSMQREVLRFFEKNL